MFLSVFPEVSLNTLPLTFDVTKALFQVKMLSQVNVLN